MPHTISKACNKCGVCLVECPTDSIIEGKDQYYIDADTCADHAVCVNVCPVNAISRITDSGPATRAVSAEEED